MRTSTWIDTTSVDWFQLFCIKIVKNGRVPRHVAFIMDGNRRYAERKGLPRRAGHEAGFCKLAQTLKWCVDLGVREVTVYAFSIENLKRSYDEVETLMNIAREKFCKLLDEVEQMNSWGVRVVVVGRLSLLPADMRAMAARVMLRTRGNTNLRINVAYCYTGRDELASAVSELEHIIDPESAGFIDAELISEALPLSAPDLIVRTSGELRISDFMIWQVSDTVLYFTPALWPDFTIWHMLRAVLHYQRHAPAPRHRSTHEDFVETLSEARWQRLEEYAEASCEGNVQKVAKVQ